MLNYAVDRFVFEEPAYYYTATVVDTKETRQTMLSAVGAVSVAAANLVGDTIGTTVHDGVVDGTKHAASKVHPVATDDSRGSAAPKMEHTVQTLWPFLPIVRSTSTEFVDVAADDLHDSILIGGFHDGLVGRFWPGNYFYVGSYVGNVGGRQTAVTPAPASQLDDRTYDWWDMPLWWRVSFFACLVGYLCCALWDCATTASAGWAALHLAIMAIQITVRIALHLREEVWFARWRERSDTAEAGSQVRQPAEAVGWGRALAITVMLCIPISLLNCEAAVFSSPAAHEGSSFTVMGGLYPMPTQFTRSVVLSVAVHCFNMGIGYKGYHAGVILLRPSFRRPPWLPGIILLEIVLLGPLILFQRFAPSPSSIAVGGYGSGFLFIIGDLFQLTIRCVRMCGLPRNTKDSTTSWLIFSTSIPYFYYIAFHVIPLYGLKASAGSQDFDGEVCHHSANCAVQGWFDPTKTNSSNITNRAETTGVSFFNFVDSSMSQFWLWMVWILFAAVSAVVLAFFVDKRRGRHWPSQTHVWPLLPTYAAVLAWVAPLSLLIESMVVAGTIYFGLAVPGTRTVWVQLFAFAVGSELNGFLCKIVGSIAGYIGDPRTFESELALSPMVVTVYVLGVLSVTPFSINSWQFWLCAVATQIVAPAMTTLPMRELCTVLKQPRRYRTVFFKQFPWEAIRSESVIMQLTAVAQFVFIVVPMVTTNLRGGVGPRGKPHGWFACGDEKPIGLEIAKFFVIFVLSSLRNGARFVFAKWACTRLGKEVAPFRTEVEETAGLPWPDDAKLRTSTEILGSLGYMGPIVITLSSSYLLLFSWKGVVLHEACYNNPEEASIVQILLGQRGDLYT
jgi:hypothetical protein